MVRAQRGTPGRNHIHSLSLTYYLEWGDYQITVSSPGLLNKFYFHVFHSFHYLLDIFIQHPQDDSNKASSSSPPTTLVLPLCFFFARPLRFLNNEDKPGNLKAVLEFLFVLTPPHHQLYLSQRPADSCS